MSRKKARSLHRDLSPITRLAFGATNLAKQTTQAISSSQDQLNKSYTNTSVAVPLQDEPKMGNNLQVARGRGNSKRSNASTLEKEESLRSIDNNSLMHKASIDGLK